MSIFNTDDEKQILNRIGLKSVLLYPKQTRAPHGYISVQRLVIGLWSICLFKNEVCSNKTSLLEGNVFCQVRSPCTGVSHEHSLNIPPLVCQEESTMDYCDACVSTEDNRDQVPALEDIEG